MVEEANSGSGDSTERPRTGEYGENRSDVDAMGNDKRREVVGQQYGATVRKRLFIYGAAVGVIVAIVIVFLTVVTNYDNRERPLENTAPWSAANASQVAPRDVDFKANGPRQCESPCSSDITIRAKDIVNR